MRGVSTRKVDELVKALGRRGISKSRVSELCEELDEEVERFLTGRSKALTLTSGSTPLTSKPARTAGWLPRRWS